MTRTTTFKVECKTTFKDVVRRGIEKLPVIRVEKVNE